MRKTARYSLTVVAVLAGAGALVGKKALDRGLGARAEPTAEELAEMEDLNPKSRATLREEEEVRRFFAGEAAAAPGPAAAGHGH